MFIPYEVKIRKTTKGEFHETCARIPLHVADRHKPHTLLVINTCINVQNL
jgi:hypothetical protein